jgi:hypothetical protein
MVHSLLVHAMESEDNKVDETVETSTDMTQPIIIDLGAQKKGNLKDLKKGEGKLFDEVLNVVDEVKVMLGENAAGKVIVPVVVLYQEKPKRRRLEKMIFPYFKGLR